MSVAVLVCQWLRRREHMEDRNPRSHVQDCGWCALPCGPFHKPSVYCPMNCNHFVALIKSQFLPSKQPQGADFMLQYPFVCIIVFKNPDWQFVIIIIMHIQVKQEPLSLMDEAKFVTGRCKNCPPSLSFHVHRYNFIHKHERMHNTIEKDTSWTRAQTSIMTPWSSFGWVNIHPCEVLTLIFHILDPTWNLQK